MRDEQRRRDPRLDPVDRVPTRDGIRVAAYDFGGSGTDVLLLHATGFCAATLEPLARRLADVGFRCWAIDLRAHGRSDPPPGDDFGWSGFADDVASAVAHLGLRRPLVVGHSCGGAAAVLAEEARPGTFAGLYCFEPVILPVDHPFTDGTNPLSVAARRRRGTFPSSSAAFENFAAKPPLGDLDPEVLHLYVEEGMEAVPADEGGDGVAVRLRCRRDHEAAVFAHAGSHRAYSHLSEVTCPVALACGARTDSFGPAFLEGLAARLPDSRLQVLPDVGHLGPLEDPPLVAASVRSTFPESDTPEP